MSVSGIGAGYPAYYEIRKLQQNTTEKSFANQVNNVASVPKTYQVYMMGANLRKLSKAPSFAVRCTREVVYCFEIE